MLSNHYYHSHGKILKRPSITVPLDYMGPENSADGSNQFNVRITEVNTQLFKVSLLTIQNDGSSTTAFTFEIDELVKALKNPREKLAKVLSEEKNPWFDILDPKKHCLSECMQDECTQRYIFRSILWVILRYIENNNISVILTSVK